MKKDLTNSVLTGVLLALSFPPLRTGFLAYFALIPFFILLEDKKVGETFRWSYVTGFFISVMTLYWIGWVTMLGLVGALLIIPLFTGLYGLLHRFLLKKLGLTGFALLPFAWTVVEYIQSLGDTAFPWNYLGYTQSYYLPMIQFAEYTGVYGVSFWIVAINVMLLLLWKNRSSLTKSIGYGALILFLLLVPLVHGLVVMRGTTNKTKSIKISLLQGNVDPFEKWDSNSKEKNFKIYKELLLQVADSKSDLYIWPETAAPFYLRYENEYMNRMQTLLDSCQSAMLTGAIDFDHNDKGDYDYYNAALLFVPDAYDVQRYAKMHLVPFSERVPYRDYFPFNVIKNLLFDMAMPIGDYARGKSYTIFSANLREYYLARTSGDSSIYRFSVPICFESAFPEIVRRFIINGADFLVIITNDAWFGKTSAPYQHAQMAVFRAIENRVPIARCANTGVSCFIDQFGRMRQATHIFKKEIVTGIVELSAQRSFYTSNGDVFLYFIAFTLAFAVVIAVVRKSG